MYARVASFEGGDPDRLRAETDRRMAAGQQPEGMQGFLMLADSEANRRLFVSFFESREDLDRANTMFEKMGDEIPEEVRGRRTSLDVYEVVAQQIPAAV